MLAWLVLVGGLHLVRTADFPKDTNHVIIENVSCSASGVFLQREEGPNSVDPNTCYLCFCQNNRTAVCWRRENRGCDLEHYRNLGTRNPRARRSPLSFSEVFVRDATRDFFNKQSPEQCKPFESSFSDGCPPADWCIGCTVCDCDANGHWDCHVLSFCPDKNGKKQMKKRRGHPDRRMLKRQSKTSTAKVARTTRKTTKPPKKLTKKRNVNAKSKLNRVKQSSAVNKHKVNQIKATRVNKYVPVKKPIPKLQTKRNIPNRNKVTSKPLYIKKHVSTGKPGNIKSSTDKTDEKNTVEVAQKVVKQFMSTMQKMFKNINLKTNKTSDQENKVLKKRSMAKYNNKKDIKETGQKQKIVTKPTFNVGRRDSGKRNTPKSYSPYTSKYGRIKRQLAVVDITYNNSESNNLTVIDKNVKNNNTQDLTSNNTNSVLGIKHNFFSNETVKFVQPENTTNREIYETDIHVDVLHDIVQNEPFYKNVNKTNSVVSWTPNDNRFLQNASNNKDEDIISVTTNRSYLLTNITQDDFNNNRTDFKQILQQNYNGRESFEIKKEYSNISISTEEHNCKFRTLLQKIIGTDTKKYNDTVTSFETRKKSRRYTILNKIKRLFKTIFNKKKTNKFYYKDNLYFNDYNIGQSDYKRSAHCKLDSKEKNRLRQSIYELKHEGENILKIIRIIKGLLHIVEMNTSKTKYKDSSESCGSNNNINKLNAIVKNTYPENSKKLTQDQQTQINYIKNNVQVFIKSIGKFARLLDDIIQTASCDSKKEYKNYDVKLNKKSNVINNIVKDYSDTTQAKLEKLKKLILNYNTLQNKFIHHIYVVLNNLGSNITDKDNLKPKVHSEHYIIGNKTGVIETNSANIIKNIRKLKHLAERINVQKRRKRESIDDDDALEYLLILMEYLLKKHGPVYPSVNDGLDLLLEAIKSAPNIKLNRKKILDNVTEKSFVTRSTASIQSFENYNNYSNSNTVRDKTNYSSEISGNRKNVTKHSEDDDVDEDKVEEIYHSFKSGNNLSSEQKHGNILLARSNISITSESYYNIHNEATTRINRNKDNEILSFKVEHDFLNEEIARAPITIGVESDTSSVSSVTDHSNIITDNVSQIKSKSNIDNLLVDPKANIDWIEENFKEIKQSREAETGISTPKSLTATRTYKHTDNNISDNTNENEAFDQKKVEKISAEDIMSKKQLDLLNSLDYVEDEVESNDKFSSDTYI